MECRLLLIRSAPLIVTFLLEYSFTAASIFAVGHIGKVELAATAVASLTANITGYAIYQGLATSLDTLCPSAYGAGRKDLVGLHCQRMVCFLWFMTVPIAIAWVCADSILKIFVQPQIAEMAGAYLRVLVLGTPGYAAFECGKRFMLAQGLFSATVWILLFCAPLNAILNYLFVWVFNWGFIGAPMAVVVVETLMPTLLAVYIACIAGSECWNGFTRAALQDWWPMVRLALPGMLMVEAELMAWELLTLASSFISVEHLAAQSTIATLGAIAFNFHFPISIVAATRVSTLIGAGHADAAKVAARVSGLTALVFGLLVATLLGALRNQLPELFTGNPEVIHLVSTVLPLVGISQVFDSLATSCNGLLRGLGKQTVGGITALICYYGVGIPVSLALAFHFHWELQGLAVGTALALLLIALIEGIFMANARWEGIVEQANRRNAESA
ncbi:MATE efflux family protein [Aspergillus pseudotamarii]|uniref:MATE efflux family protein n=1 Tax=Aspergillus pseudotamarii TaxID=132259 RepID=A0A5N6T7V2_ASPPS|nr:MATE efflux family protein [Aspergillus pseudotamarii]KAE8142316.1 MATE efflux family protein [Aspergillus pseudotamarii]